MGGYSDKMALLLQRVFEKMTNFVIDENRFDVIKETVSTHPTWGVFYQASCLIFTDKFNLSQSDARISVTYNSRR